MIAIGLLFVRTVRLVQAATAAGSRNPNTAASAQCPAAAHAAPSAAFALGRPRPVHLALSSLPGCTESLILASWGFSSRPRRASRGYPIRGRRLCITSNLAADVSDGSNASHRHARDVPAMSASHPITTDLVRHNEPALRAIRVISRCNRVGDHRNAA